MNSILTQVFLLWNAKEVASSGEVCELEWVHGVWDDGVDVIHFKAFHGYRCLCVGAIVIQKSYLGVLGHKDYGGLLETCRHYRLAQGEVENVSENTCQLVNACSEYGLVNVKLFKDLTHIGYGECDHVVVRNRWCSHSGFSILQRYAISSALCLVGPSFVFQLDNDPTHLQTV